MRRRIEDEFTNLTISRQRKYQLRKQRDKRCTECGEPAEVDTNTAEPLWSPLPCLQKGHPPVLVIDDILDEGETLHAVKQKLIEMGASRVYAAVLADKDIEKTKPIKADFVGLRVPNRFVFGCGMDAYGLWGNLPEIRALKEE